jgi:hypothetical protein
MTKLTPAVAPSWIFPQHQHEQHHKTDTFHLMLYDALPLCFLFCSSIFVQTEHFLLRPKRRKKLKYTLEKEFRNKSFTKYTLNY